MNLLIPYIHLSDHSDPALNEFTYGDVGPRGRKLSSAQRGDMLFFHTTLGGKKVITAYYVVDRVIRTEVASRDPLIVAKYRNPHIEYCRANGRAKGGGDDFVVFGDPILSAVLPKPLTFDKSLATKLTLAIPFPPGRTETQAIGAATRSWRTLTERDVRVLQRAAERVRQLRSRSVLRRSSEEVGEVIEKDIEEHLARNPTLLGKGLKLKDRQLPLAVGRIDLLFEEQNGALLLVEVKIGRIGRDAIAQVEGYMAELRHFQHHPVRSAIVCAGVMPAFEEDFRKKRSINILIYGWDLNVTKW